MCRAGGKAGRPRMTTVKSEKDWERREPPIIPKNQKILDKLGGSSKDNLFMTGVSLWASMVWLM